MGRRAPCGMLLLLVLWAALSSTAAPPDAAEERRLIQEEKERIVQRAIQERSVLRALAEIDGRYRAQARDLAALREEEKRLAAVLADNRREYEKTAADLARAREMAGRRLAALYKLYRGSGLTYLFSAEGAPDFVRRYRLALFVARDDLAAIQRYRESAAAMEEMHRALLARQEEVRALSGRVAMAFSQTSLTRRQHAAVLAEIRANRTLAEIHAGEMEAEAQAVQASVDRLPQEARGAPLNFAQIQGYLDTPVRGRIVGRFGKRVHQRFGTVTYNRGIDLAAAEGTPVRVVFDGTVQLVQDFLGYGRMVIVDHGDRFHTLYAPVDEPRVQPGQKVRRGEVLGQVGRTADREEAVLHFEVRHQGHAQDPEQWLFRAKGR